MKRVLDNLLCAIDRWVTVKGQITFSCNASPPKPLDVVTFAGT